MKVTKSEMSIAIKILQAYNDGNLDLDNYRYDEFALTVEEAGRQYYDDVMDDIRDDYTEEQLFDIPLPDQLY